MSEKEKKTEELEQETVEVEETLETPTQTDDEVQEEVKSDVEVLQEKLEEMEDKFLRASAEIANITNRNRNEREQLQKYRSQDLGKKLLTSLDLVFGIFTALVLFLEVATDFFVEVFLLFIFSLSSISNSSFDFLGIFSSVK